MSRPLAVKGGGASPSLFSTPGFPPAASLKEASFGDRPEHCWQDVLAGDDAWKTQAPGFLDIGWHDQGTIPSLTADLHQQTRLAASAI